MSGLDMWMTPQNIYYMMMTESQRSISDDKLIQLNLADGTDKEDEVRLVRIKFLSEKAN